jgi:hypothetical protein
MMKFGHTEAPLGQRDSYDPCAPSVGMVPSAGQADCSAVRNSDMTFEQSMALVALGAGWFWIW